MKKISNEIETPWIKKKVKFLEHLEKSGQYDWVMIIDKLRTEMRRFNADFALINPEDSIKRNMLEIASIGDVVFLPKKVKKLFNKIAKFYSIRIDLVQYQYHEDNIWLKRTGDC